MAKQNTSGLRQQFLEIIGGIEPKDLEYFHGKTADQLIEAAEKFYKKTKTPKTITAFTGCIDAYNEFIIKQTGLPGKFDGAEGKAMKSIIIYLKQVSHDKTDEGIINSFKHILVLHDRWDPFHKNQLKLQQINSNLINIINAIKNGTNKNKYEQSKYRTDQPNSTQPANI